MLGVRRKGVINIKIKPWKSWLLLLCQHHTGIFKCGVQCPVSKRNIQCVLGFACGELEMEMYIAGGFGRSLYCSNLDVSRSQSE